MTEKENTKISQKLSGLRLQKTFWYSEKVKKQPRSNLYDFGDEDADQSKTEYDFGDEDAKTGTPSPTQQIINNPLFISQTGDNSNVIPNYGTMNLTLGKHGGGSNE